MHFFYPCSLYGLPTVNSMLHYPNSTKYKGLNTLNCSHSYNISRSLKKTDAKTPKMFGACFILICDKANGATVNATLTLDRSASKLLSWNGRETKLFWLQ
jgi:hypothetical protein